MKHLRTLIMSLFLLSPLLLSACIDGVPGSPLCGANSDCPAGQVCRETANVIVANSFSCSVVSCSSQSDCAPSEVCINSACQCPENNPSCGGL